MLIFWPISSLGDAYKRYLSDAYKKKTCIKIGVHTSINDHVAPTGALRRRYFLINLERLQARQL